MRSSSNFRIMLEPRVNELCWQRLQTILVASVYVFNVYIFTWTFFYIGWCYIAV